MASWPTWPWAYGDAREPKGTLCAICNLVHRIGSFDIVYKSMTIVIEEMKKSSSLTDEWINVLYKTIMMLNCGEVPMKMRGKVKDGLLTQCKYIRTCTVNVIETRGIRVKEKFIGITMTRWAVKYPEIPDPKAEGYHIKKLFVAGMMQDCAIMRKGVEGEVDVDFESSMMAVRSEEMENNEIEVLQFFHFYILFYDVLNVYDSQPDLKQFMI